MEAIPGVSAFRYCVAQSSWKQHDNTARAALGQPLSRFTRHYMYEEMSNIHAIVVTRPISDLV